MRKSIKKCMVLLMALCLCMSCATPIIAREASEPSESTSISESQLSSTTNPEGEQSTSAPQVEDTASNEQSNVVAEDSSSSTVESTSQPQGIPQPTQQPTPQPASSSSVVEQASPQVTTAPVEQEGNATINQLVENGDVLAQGQCGENLTWTLSNEYVLTISGTGPMYEFRQYYDPEDTKPENPWRNYNYQIKSVNIQEGCTTISKNAFQSFNQMVSVSLPNSLQVIEDSAFAYCYKLENILIPDSVTSLGKETFQYCMGLKTLSIGAGVSNIGENTFVRCDILESIVVNPSNEYYQSLQNALLTKDGKVLIKYATTNTNTEYLIPNGVEKIETQAFYSAQNLTNVVFPNSVKEIGMEAFYGCSNLTELNLPESLEMIGDSAFAYCDNIIYAYLGANLHTLGKYVFFDDTKLVNIELNKDNSYFRMDKNAILGKIPDVEGEAIIQYTLGAAETSYTVPNTVTTVAYGAFATSANLKEVILPSSVTKIETEAFRNMPNLESIPTLGQTREIGMFSFGYCQKLSNIKVPNTVTTIGAYAFYGTGIQSITIPQSVTEYDSGVFSGCEQLVEATIYANMDTMPWATFRGCTNLKTITLGKPLTTIERYAFEDANALETVNYIGSEESWSNIQIDDGNDSLQKATIVYNWKPEGITSDIYDIQGNLVMGVGISSTVDQVKQNFISGAEIVILDSNGQNISSDSKAPVGTGCKVGTINSDPANDADWMVIVVYGDLTGDGAVQSVDLLQMRRYMLAMDSISAKPECYLKAATPISKSEEEPSSLDLLQMRRFMLGLAPSMTA